MCPLPRPHDVAHHNAGECRHAAWKRKRISQVVGSLSSFCFKASSGAPKRKIFCLRRKSDYPCFGHARREKARRPTRSRRFRIARWFRRRGSPQPRDDTGAHLFEGQPALCHNGLASCQPLSGATDSALCSYTSKTHADFRLFRPRCQGTILHEPFCLCIPSRRVIPYRLPFPYRPILTRRILCTCIA